MQAKRLEYVSDPNKFDLVVHRWDFAGNLIAKAPYRLHNVDGRNYFERPVNSGNLWYENNQPAGRVELTFGETGKVSAKKFNFGAAHVEYVPPMTGDAKLHYELEQLKARNAQIAAELASIKQDQTPKATEPKADAAKAVPTLKARG